MELIWSLFKLLSEEQKTALKSLCRKSNKAYEKLIFLCLNGQTDEDELLKKLQVSANTLSKIQTQAKDMLAQYIQKDIQNPLDEVHLVQLLIMKGEIKAATKFYNALEKEYERKQKWQLLDALLKEGYRLAQLTGNLKLLEDVVEKRNHYIDKHAASAKLYGDVMIEVVRSEKFDYRKEDAAIRYEKIAGLNRRAYEVGHHALIHNTLTVLYNHLLHFSAEPDEVWSIVKKIEENRTKFSEAMQPGVEATSRIVLINFLCTCDGYGKPDPHIPEAWKRIDHGGTIAKTTLLYALLGYYLCEEQSDKVAMYLSELEKIEDKTHFASFKAIIMAILSFMEGNYTAFQLHYNLFYSDPNHIDLPDNEVIIRVLELIILHTEGETWLYKSKADALRTYFNRNLNKIRYAGEYDILSYLITPNEKNRERVERLQHSKYRNVRMLTRYVLKHIPASKHKL